MTHVFKQYIRNFKVANPCESSDSYVIRTGHVTTCVTLFGTSRDV